MSTTILYGVVIQYSNGGQQMSSFLKEDSALSKAEEVISIVKNSNKKGFKVYLSELEYDNNKNLILSESLVNEDSELLFES
ncbi:hypothetical protein FDJ58_gp095 [Bacillus phage SIOphi]|uniref:Uncharacterized protein n=1 Tax=Bacillus phage SIOphi TaxID=1285382 RepID=R4JF03_9CAUD|nr:hypothetical protein FDJ58_gp095 [Bacillus phage SIOphi]AGK86903.1 hypothetical protein SIOphi_00475 [Bacillus phage SIOphi]